MYVQTWMAFEEIMKELRDDVEQKCVNMDFYPFLDQSTKSIVHPVTDWESKNVHIDVNNVNTLNMKIERAKEKKKGVRNGAYSFSVANGALKVLELVIRHVAAGVGRDELVKLIFVQAFGFMHGQRKGLDKGVGVRDDPRMGSNILVGQSGKCHEYVKPYREICSCQ